ncbi:anti-sigma factor family protein [Streptodolium elevatio]
MTAQNRMVGPDGHVDVDVLSDLVEGLLSDPEAAEVRAHVAECAECRDTVDALAEVRELLAAQPAEPMPDDVYARIESALAEAAGASGGAAGAAGVDAEVPAPRPSTRPDLGSLPPPRPRGVPEASARVVDLGEVRRRRLAPGLLGAAAAVAAVLLLVGVVVSGGLGGSDSDSNSDSQGAASAPLQEQGTAGRPGGPTGAGPPGAAAPSASSAAALPEYHEDNLRSQVAALLGRQGRPGLGSDSAETTTSRPAVPDAPGVKGAAAGVPRCVTEAAEDEAAGRSLIASERARYLDQVAYVLVYTRDSASVDVVVVSAACDEPATVSASRSPVASWVLLSRIVPTR